MTATSSAACWRLLSQFVGAKMPAESSCVMPNDVKWRKSVCTDFCVLGRRDQQPFKLYELYEARAVRCQRLTTMRISRLVRTYRLPCGHAARLQIKPSTRQAQRVHKYCVLFYSFLPTLSPSTLLGGKWPLTPRTGRLKKLAYCQDIIRRPARDSLIRKSKCNA